MSHVAHQGRDYPGLSSIPGWDAGPSQDYPLALNLPVPICTTGWREAL